MNDYFVELVSLFAGFFRICVDKLLIHAVMCSWRYEMEPLFFVSSEDFENWLDTNHQTSKGVWIKFDKSKNNTRLTNQEAVRVALCYGWINGHVKRIDERYFINYFTKRLKTSVWSTINKKTALELIEKGLMKPSGLAAVILAQQDGGWEKADRPPIDFDLDSFTKLIKQDALVYENYMQFSVSIRKTYAMSYFALKKEESRQRRLLVVIDRLRNNLKPM